MLNAFSDMFTPSQLSYLAVLGQSQYDENKVKNRLKKDIPTGLKEYRFLMHPVRLLIVRTLYKNFSMISTDIKEVIDVSWSEYTSHINALEKNGLVSANTEFHENGLKVNIVYLEEQGRMEYENLITLLQTFLKGAKIDFFEEETDALYPVG